MVSLPLINSMCNINAIPASPSTMNASAPSSVLQDQFEFTMAFHHASHDSESTPILVSPADDLFYKGQLLPLLLPSRIKMVQELSSSADVKPRRPCTITKQHHNTSPCSSIFPIKQDLHVIEEDINYPNDVNYAYANDVADYNEVKDYTTVKDLIDLCNYEDTEADADADADNTTDQASSPLLYNGREDPSLFPDCYQDPTAMMASSTSSSFCNIYSHGASKTHENNSSNNNNNIGGVAAKYAARWKSVLFRRGKKCSAILEATCCHYTRSGSCTNRDHMVSSTNQADIKLLSSNRSTWSCKAAASASASSTLTLTSSSSTSSTRSSTSVESSVAPRDSLSTIRTSSASCVSTSSVVSSSHCGVPRTTSKAARKEISTRSAHKERLVSKAKDCLQKSLRVLRLKRLSQKANQRTSFLLRKSNGAAIHSENILNKLDENFIQQEEPRNDTKRECLHHQQQHDMDIGLGGRDHDSNSEDDDHNDDDMVDTDNESSCSDAGFITIDPSTTIFYRNNPSLLTRPNGSRSSSFSSSDIELDINPIKGAIAHCKRSSQKSGLSHRG